MFYTVPAADVATTGSADTFKTIAAILVADTAGHRARLRRLTIGFADNTPADAQVSFQVKRILDVSAGGAGTSTAVTPGKVDPGTPASLVSAGKNFTVEPTAYETDPLWTDDLNTRGGVVIEWNEDDAPRVTQDMLLGVLAAPRAAAAQQVTVTMEVEQY